MAYDGAYIFCGSRNLELEQTRAIEIDLKQLPKKSLIITGGAKGADEIAADLAFRMGNFDIETYEAPWKEEGKRAGFLRNARMKNRLVQVDAIEKKVYAYFLTEKETKGTAMMCQLAEDAGIEVIRHYGN